MTGHMTVPTHYCIIYLIVILLIDCMIHIYRCTYILLLYHQLIDTTCCIKQIVDCTSESEFIYLKYQIRDFNLSFPIVLVLNIAVEMKWNLSLSELAVICS